MKTFKKTDAKMGLRNRSLFDRQGSIYFVTTTVMNWDKIFLLDDNYNEIIIPACRRQGFFEILA